MERKNRTLVIPQLQEIFFEKCHEHNLTIEEACIVLDCLKVNLLETRVPKEQQY